MNAMVRQVSSKSVENQLEVESKLDELHVLNQNLQFQLDRTKLELETAKQRATERAKEVQHVGVASPGLASDGEVERYKKHIQTLEDNIKTLSEERKAVKSKLKAYENHQERLKVTYKNLSDMYNKLRGDYAQLAKKYKSAKVKAVSSQTSTLVAVANELEREKIRRERDDVMDELNRMRGIQMNEINVAKEERAEAMRELELLKSDILRMEEAEEELRKLLEDRVEKARQLDIVSNAATVELQQMRVEKDELQKDLASQSEKSRMLEHRAESLEAKLKELESAVENSMERENGAVSVLEEVKGSMGKLEREKAQEISNLKTERDKLLNELVLASKKNKELQSSSENQAVLINELEDLRRQMDDEKRRSERQQSEMQQLIDTGAADFRRVSEELETLLLKMSLAEKSYGSEIKELRDDLDRASERLEVMRKASDDIERAVKNERDAALTKVAELERENRDLNSSLTSKTERSTRELDDLKSKNARELETLKNTHGVLLAGLEKEFRDKYNRIVTERDSYQKQLFEMSEKLDIARTDLEVAKDSMRNEIEAAKVELVTSLSEIDRLSKLSIEQEDQNESLSKKIALLEKAKTQDLATIQEAEDRFKEMREETRKRITERETELATIQSKCESLEASLRAARQEHSAAISALQVELTSKFEAEEHRRQGVEADLKLVTREKEEALLELKAVASQNYEERTQALSKDLVAAREERDRKNMEINGAIQRRMELESFLKQKDRQIAQLTKESEVLTSELETAMSESKILVQELKSDHAKALEQEEHARERVEQELRSLREEYALTRRSLEDLTSKQYDSQIEELQKMVASLRGDTQSLNNELDQTRELLRKRSEAADSEKARNTKEMRNLRYAAQAAESRLEEVVKTLNENEDNYQKRIQGLELEREELTASLESHKRSLSRNSKDLDELSRLREVSDRNAQEAKIADRQREELTSSLSEARVRVSGLEDDLKRVNEELKIAKRECSAEVKRAVSERDDVFTLMQQTRAQAKQSEMEVDRMSSKIKELEDKVKQQSSDMVRLREDRDKTLKDIDELQATLSQKGAASDATDKKGKTIEAQLRAAYTRERTLQMRVNSLLEENKVLKEGLKKGDSFDSVLNDLVAVKVALAIAEEDKLLLRDELRKYKGTDV
uniref:Uncharacterized protein n=1 Tax=Compsopogon caeruleus TaxID=31354 RepID=A0A6T6D282_9RHOD